MPGPLTYTAITLLARDRVREIRDTLGARLRTATTSNDIEKQIWYLADKTLAFMTADQPSFRPPLRLYGPPLTDQVSKFLMVGAIGPELPAYAGMSTPSAQTWLRNVLHKGTPDENKEQAITGSTNFVLDFWTRVQPLLSQEFPSASDRDKAAASMRAYLLGHVCHVAADVITAPYISELEWRLGDATQAKLTRQQIIGAMEAKVASGILDHARGTRTKDWGDWWPSPGQIPRSFYKAYSQTVQNLYGDGATRRKGFGEVEDELRKHPPLALNEDLIRDGYSTFRTIAQMGAAWDFCDWVSATFLFYVPAFLALPFAALLPNAKDMYRAHRPPNFDSSTATYEMVVYPYAATSIVPVIAAIIFSLSHAGACKAVVIGWISAILQVAAGIGFFATLGSKADTGKWVLLFFLPVALEILHVVLTFLDGTDNRHVQLALSSILHSGLSLLFLLLYAAFLHFAIEGWNDEHGKSGAFWGLLGVWLVILAGVCALMSLIFKAFVNHQPDDRANDFVTQRRQRIRLFDDTTLFTTAVGTSPTLAQLSFPSGRRKLLKMWWNDPAVTPTILSNRTELVFNFGAGPPLTIAAPVAPIRLADFAAYLEHAVKDRANKTNLKTKIIYPEDYDYELPSGPVFSDNGDDQTTQALHDTQAGVAKPLGGNEQSAFVLYHAPKMQQSVPYLASGPAFNDEERSAQKAGVGNITADATGLVITVAGAGATPFTKFFRPGDLIVATNAHAPQRTVVSVNSDTQLTISTAFPAGALPGGFARGRQDRRVDFPAPAAWTVAPYPIEGPIFSVANDLIGSGGQFGEILMPGDIIRVLLPPPGKNQELMVIRLVSDTQITVSQPLDIPSGIAATFQFVRLGQEPRFAFNFLATGDDSLTSADSVMNHAADFGALLCLGATSQLLDQADLDRARIHTPFDRVGTAFDLERVFQVFRNWNLDRRRENEWRMLVLGGAVSEKRGDPAAPDAALPTLPSGWHMYTPKGEPTATQLGWLPLLRSWLDMAGRPGTDTKAQSAFRAGDPSNLDLSRGLAFLFDMRDPDPAAP